MPRLRPARPSFSGGRRLAVAFLSLGALWLSPAIPVAGATPGDLDPTFGEHGKLISGFELGRSSDPGGVALQADGKVVAGGSASDFMALSSMALVRFNRDGSLDTSFSGDGRQTARFGEFDYGSDVAVQPDGRILLIGSAGGAGGAHDFGLARFNPDGSLDPTFSGDGRQTIDFGGDEEAIGGVGGLALQSDGKIVAVGMDRRLGPHDFAVARLNPDGSPDRTFSGDGRQTTDFGRFDVATAVAIQADGKIVAAGRTETQINGGDTAQLPGAFALARYNPDGSLDLTFSGDGKQTTDFGSYDRASGVAIQADGKIVAAGSFTLPSGTSQVAYFALTRYTPDGSLDPTFSGDGRLVTGGLDYGSGLALQPDGKIVAVGGGNDFTLARFNPDGTADTTFACLGRQKTDFGGGERATSVALYPDGRIVAAGYGGGGYRTSGLALARYLGETDRSPPHVSLILARRQRLRALVRGGLRFQVRVNEAPRISARLEISRRLARRLGIVRGGRGRRPVTIGRGSARLRPACSRSSRARVRLTRTARGRIKRAKGVRATLRLRVSDAAGNTSTALRRIRFG